MYGFKTTTNRIMTSSVLDREQIISIVNGKMNSLKALHHDSPLIFGKDVDVHEDVKAVDEMALTERLHKSGKKLRSFKANFSEPKYYPNTIANGIILRKVHIMCHAEAIKLFG